MSDTADTLRAVMDPDPALSHRFLVTFLHFGLIPNPIDFRFQRVSGMGANMEMQSFDSGGENLHRHHLPKKTNYNNLVLERGYSTSLIVSPVTLLFEDAFNDFSFSPCRILVMLFSKLDIATPLGGGLTLPVGAWCFEKAVPVRWSYSDMDAQSDKVFMDKMEFTYTRCVTVGI